MDFDEMKNVYLTRQEANAFYIVDDAEADGLYCPDTAVIIHLHYMDTVHHYERYINDIPSEIDIYITSSVEGIIGYFTEKYANRNNTKIIHKDNNRGRDISSLLVSLRDVVCHYRFFCFIHDKKSISEELAEDTRDWIENLWDNMLFSRGYIRNIIAFFLENPKCGILIPPERFGQYFNDWAFSGWGGDYKNTQRLAIKLGVEAIMDEKYPPIALGTVFWARTKSLDKLLEYAWCYDDFPEEPMPYDGTISHAIERIFPFVCQDAGYEIYTVMTKCFASKLLTYSKRYAFAASGILRKYRQIYNLYEMEYENEFLDRIIESQNNNVRIYLFGAGAEGRKCLYFLKSMGIMPESFVVSSVFEKNSIEGLSVEEYTDCLEELKKALVIITVQSGTAQSEIRAELEGAHVNNISYWRRT